MSVLISREKEKCKLIHKFRFVDLFYLSISKNRKLFIVSAILFNCIYFSYAGVSIRCYFHDFEFPDPVNYLYSCDNGIVTLDPEGSTNVTSITGTHEAGKTNADVYGIRMPNQTYLTFLPSKLETHFPNLKSIQISNTNLLSVTPAELQPFPQLIFFKTYGGNLTSVDGHLFTHNPFLQYISMNENLIQHVGHDLVTHLANLTNLYFSANVCINQYAETRDGVMALNALLPVRCPPLQYDEPRIEEIN